MVFLFTFAPANVSGCAERNLSSLCASERCLRGDLSLLTRHSSLAAIRKNIATFSKVARLTLRRRIFR